MADQNIRTVVAAAVFLRNCLHHRFGDRVVINGCVDAVARHLGGKLVHAKRENVHQAAHQIDMRAGGVLGGNLCALRSCR
jgi:hypothetical protein